LSDTTYEYEVLQDKAAAKLRNDTTQRKRPQGIFKAKPKLTTLVLLVMKKKKKVPHRPRSVARELIPCTAQ